MHRLTTVLILFLAACTYENKMSYRDRSVPISSIVLFEVEKFFGHWDVVESFDNSVCGYDVGLHINERFDLTAWGCSGARNPSAARVIGPGRFTSNGAVHSGAAHWVMWVDQSYRTAVIGTPDGEFGMILNRGRDIPVDRLSAARAILDWSGYDLTRMIPMQKGE